MVLNILIVDDEITIRKGLSDYVPWDDIGCAVVGTAVNGLDAQEKIKSLRPHIVITDIKMPGMNGIDLAKFISENYPTIGVIILTGYAEFKFAQSAIHYGVSDYVLKPISKDTLLDSVAVLKERLLAHNSQIDISQEKLFNMREQFFRQLAENDLAADKIISRAAECDIFLENYCVVAFGYSASTLSQREQPLEFVRNALKDSYPQDHWFHHAGLLLWVYGFRQKKDQPQAILDICTEIAEIGESLYALSLSAGISLRHQALQQFADAFQEAQLALEQNFYSKDKASFYQRIDVHHLPPSNITASLLTLEEHLQKWEFEAGRLLTHAIFDQFKTNFTPPMEVKILCLRVYYLCVGTLEKKGLPSEKDGFPAKLFQGSSIFELEDATINLLGETETLLGSQGKRVGHITQKALQYIHDNYRDDLSLEIIAEHIPTNPSHLSRTFKREYGIPLTEYINRYRIGKAQESLCLSDVLGYEVAELVGYKDPTYFSATFKRYTGISPSEYRQLHTK